jgi:hypothetical protein
MRKVALDHENVRACIEGLEVHVEGRKGVVTSDRNTIDRMYLLLRKMHEQGALETPDFVELRSRLWSAREAICELLLPPAQREKVRGI